MKIDSHNINITHPDKLLFPKITKREFVRYYAEIAPTMLIHMQDRPVTMHRFPRGINEDGFYHKNIPDYFPEWITTHEIHKKSNGTTTYVICNNAATLVYLANYDCITPHVWLSTTHHLHKPDRLIFDLDPPQDDMPHLKKTAWQLKDIIESCGLTPFIMTTGSRGFHIAVPIIPEHDFATARQFAQDITRMLADQHPDRLTTAIRKKRREGRIFLDINRIAYAQTGAAAYSVRPKPKAPIATPIRWDELDNPKLMPQSYTISNILRRLGQLDDPWKYINRHKASLSDARKKFNEMF